MLSLQMGPRGSPSTPLPGRRDERAIGSCSSIRKVIRPSVPSWTTKVARTLARERESPMKKLIFISLISVVALSAKPKKPEVRGSLLDQYIEQALKGAPAAAEASPGSLYI